jgi:hypothetical protein
MSGKRSGKSNHQRGEYKMYSVKNVKTGPSREYGPKGSYTCTLYRENKKIAEAFEAGDGGGLEVGWIGDRTEVVEFKGFKQKMTHDELDFVKFCETNTYECEWSGETETYDSHMYIAKMVDDFLTTKQIKVWCRTKTVVRFKSDGEGEFSTFKSKYSPKVKEALKAKYGDQIVEIVNERFVA